MPTSYNWEKRITLNWALEISLPTGIGYETTPLTTLFEGLEYMRAVQDMFNHIYGIKLDWNGKDCPGIHYKNTADERIEHAHLFCKQGNKVSLKPDTQITIGEYTGYLCAGYMFNVSYRRAGVRVVGKDTIYKDSWITGTSFYMTNDSMLDSVDLGSVPYHTLVEFPAESEN